MLHVCIFINCKFGNFRENFVFANNAKRQVCDFKNSRLGHDLHISVIYRVISPFREGFIFTKFRIFEVSQKYPNLQFLYLIKFSERVRGLGVLSYYEDEADRICFKTSEWEFKEVDAFMY